MMTEKSPDNEIKEAKNLIEKVQDWVDTHPDDTDARHMSLATNKEFTIKEILVQLKEEKSGTLELDEETLEIKTQIAEWLDGGVEDAENGGEEAPPT